MLPNNVITTSSGYMASDCVSGEFSRRVIYIYDEITDAKAFEICCQINQLASMSSDDITLWIMSPGGSVSAGFAILDTMAACGCEIRTIVMGRAASMGAVLACSGTKGKRYIGPNAEMMIHQAMGGVTGQTTDILRTANHIRKTNDRLYTILARNTDKTVKEISADCDRDYYLDAEESIEYGLVDGVFTGFDDINE